MTNQEPLAWSYTGATAPDQWGTLSPDFALCCAGKSQSPITIQREHVQQATYAWHRDYRETSVRLINNGHTIQVNYAPGSTLTFDGRSYRLLQFHFHMPSEHAIDDTLADMELHLVHQDEAGNLAVIGVMITAGQPNTVVEPFWGQWTTEPGEVFLEDVSINIADLLPADQSLYLYDGSLTTPPCSEGVRWLVMQQPITFSQEQIAVYGQILANTNRPLQPLNNRIVNVVEVRS
jgi:carbonic anhydrase